MNPFTTVVAATARKGTRMLWLGVDQLARGLREGRSGLAAFGAMLAGVGVLRRLSRPRPQRVYSRRLRPGQTLGIRVLREGD